GAGARQVECTINGIGERAGNAALEEIVMALKVRPAYFGVDTCIDTRKLHPASRLLSQLTGQRVQRNKAIVGENAFAHESGIHQHGMLKHRGTYEIMRPQDVCPAEAALDAIFVRFKTMADKKRDVHDEDLEALALGQDPDALGPWRLLRVDTSTHLGAGASAAVKLRHDDGRETA